MEQGEVGGGGGTSRGAMLILAVAQAGGGGGGVFFASSRTQLLSYSAGQNIERGQGLQIYEHGRVMGGDEFCCCCCFSVLYIHTEILKDERTMNKTKTNKKHVWVWVFVCV